MAGVKQAAVLARYGVLACAYTHDVYTYAHTRTRMHTAPAKKVPGHGPAECRAAVARPPCADASSLTDPCVSMLLRGRAVYHLTCPCQKNINSSIAATTRSNADRTDCQATAGPPCRSSDQAGIPCTQCHGVCCRTPHMVPRRKASQVFDRHYARVRDDAVLHARCCSDLVLSATG